MADNLITSVSRETPTPAPKMNLEKAKAAALAAAKKSDGTPAGAPSGPPDKKPPPPSSGPSKSDKKSGVMSSLLCCFSGSADSKGKANAAAAAAASAGPVPPTAAKPGSDGRPSAEVGGSGGKASPPEPPSSGAKPSTPEEESVPDDYDGLLPPLPKKDANLKCLVLDLDETLVHSSFKPVPNADFIIPVEIEGTIHQVYVQKRPYVDEFLAQLGPQFEVVIFTASLSKYADPVVDLLDKTKIVKHRLFREACTNHMGNYVKDLSRLGRELPKTIIIDNSPTSYMFHPENAIAIGSWFEDPHDTELLDLIPFLEALIRVDDVCAVIESA